MSLPKPYYEQDGITIFHGDCREILPHLPKIDLVLTDPPYGINHPTNYHSRKRDRLAACTDYIPVFDDDKSFDPAPFLKIPAVLFGANYYADKLPPASGWLVWDKQRPPELCQATVELAWTNFVKGARIFHFMWHGMLRDGKDYLCHPTQKPTELMTWILSLKWTPTGTVLDPFMGSGTTLVAAKQLHRKAIGIEIEEKYCEIAVKRLGQGVLPF